MKGWSAVYMGSVATVMLVMLLNTHSKLVREVTLFANHFYLYPHLLDFECHNIQ